MAAQLLSRSIELLNGHNQPSRTTRQWILKIHQAVNQQARTWQTLLFSYGVTVTLGPPLTTQHCKECELATIIATANQQPNDQHSIKNMWQKGGRLSEGKKRKTNQQTSEGLPQLREETQEFWEPCIKKRCLLLALLAKGCPYKSLAFPEQPGPSLLWTRSYAFNDALCHRRARPSLQEDAVPLTSPTPPPSEEHTNPSDEAAQWVEIYWGFVVQPGFRCCGLGSNRWSSGNLGCAVQTYRGRKKDWKSKKRQNSGCLMTSMSEYSAG